MLNKFIDLENLKEFANGIKSLISNKQDKIDVVLSESETTNKGIYIIEDDTTIYDDVLANGANIESYIAIVDRLEQTTDQGIWIIKGGD